MFCCPPNEGVLPRFDCAGPDPNSPPPPPPPPPPRPPVPPPNIPGLFAPGGGPAGVVEGAPNNPPALEAGVEAINVEPALPPKDGLPVAGPPPPPPPPKSPPVVEAEDGAAPPGAPNNPEPPVFCWPPNEGPGLLVDGVPKRDPAGLGVEEAPP